MKIKQFVTTTTLSVSEDNLSLIALLVSYNGGLNSPSETVDEAAKRIINEAQTQSEKALIIPNLERYFGDKDKATLNAIVNAIDNGAISSTTTIKEITI